MKKNRLLPLFIITAIVVVLAIIATQRRAPTIAREPAILFPELKTSINDLNELTVQRGRKTLTLVNDAGTWNIREADGHPALFAKIKQTAIAVSDLRIVAEKTRDPQQYAALGVEDPAADKAESSLLTLKDESGKQIVSLIVGKNRLSRAAADNQGLYVRIPGQEQTLLVAGDLDIGIETAGWIDKNLINIAPDRVQHIEITRAGAEPVSLRRQQDGGDLVPEKIPAGKQARSDYVMERMEGILENITIDDVRAAAHVEFPADAVTTTVRTKDGLMVAITAAAVNEKDYARFAFSYAAPPAATQPAESQPAAATAPQAATTAKEGENAAASTKPEEPKRDVAKEAAELSTKTAGWVYQIPSYKYDTFTRKMDDLVEDLPKEEPAKKGSNE